MTATISLLDLQSISCIILGIDSYASMGGFGVDIKILSNISLDYTLYVNKLYVLVLVQLE